MTSLRSADVASGHHHHHGHHHGAAASSSGGAAGGGAGADPAADRDKRLDDGRGGFVLKARSDEPPARRRSFSERSSTIKKTLFQVSNDNIYTYGHTKMLFQECSLYTTTMSHVGINCFFASWLRVSAWKSNTVQANWKKEELRRRSARRAARLLGCPPSRRSRAWRAALIIPTPTPLSSPRYDYEFLYDKLYFFFPFFLCNFSLNLSIQNDSTFQYEWPIITQDWPPIYSSPTATHQQFKFSA